MSNSKIEEYFEANNKWNDGLNNLREIVLSTGLNETFKWNFPVYTFNGKNIVGISAFKSYFGLWFFQGALLTDHQKVLINAQKEKTKAMRQWRFRSSDEIKPEHVLSYINEAISNQEAGNEIKPDLKIPLVIPEELLNVFDKDNEVKQAFEKLSLSKQREFAEHIKEAKKESTKQNRIQKIIPIILSGKGLNDRYK